MPQRIHTVSSDNLLQVIETPLNPPHSHESSPESFSKDERILIGIRLEKCIADKVRSYSFENNRTVSEILEEVIKQAFNDVQVNDYAVQCYVEKYKKKSKV